MKYIIGNWKSNKNLAAVESWVTELKAANVIGLRDNVTAVLCPSFVHLPIVASLFPELPLGAQSLSPFPNGSYTGAISAAIASELVAYAIIGHAERRKYFHEDNQGVINQVIQALEHEITPVLAVDSHNWSDLLTLLDGEKREKVLVMYEPPEAISSNAGAHAANINEVTQAIQLIKSHFAVKGVLYGGSVHAANIHNYTGHPDIDGVVPGAASLDAQEFIQMVRNA